jgi:hypothetical protein
MPKESDFALAESPLNAPLQGDVLAKAVYLSIDPYMRTKIPWCARAVADAVTPTVYMPDFSERVGLLKTAPTIFLMLALVGLFAACGASGTAPSFTQMSGTWRGTETLVRVTGADCIAASVAGLIGDSGDWTMTIVQSGNTLTARRGDCSYRGNVGNATFTLSPDPMSCQSTTLELTCQDRTLRGIRLRTAVLSGTVNGNTASGMSTYTFDVLPAGTATSLSVLVEESVFTMRR